MNRETTAVAAALPPITLTRSDRERLIGVLNDHGPVRSWKAAEFLRGELLRARVVERPHEISAPTVTMNSQVQYRDEESGTVSTATVTYPGEADFFDDPICVLTPVGAALIGLSEGQSITYTGPEGKPMTISVVKILHQPGQPQANRRETTGAPRMTPGRALLERREDGRSARHGIPTERGRLGRLRIAFVDCDPEVAASWHRLRDCIVDAAVASGVRRLEIRMRSSPHGGFGCIAWTGTSAFRIASWPQDRLVVAWLRMPWCIGTTEMLWSLCRGLSPQRVRIKTFGQDAPASAWAAVAEAPRPSM